MVTVDSNDESRRIGLTMSRLPLGVAAAAVCGHISLPEAIALVRHVIVVARTSNLAGTGDMLSIAAPLDDRY